MFKLKLSLATFIVAVSFNVASSAPNDDVWNKTVDRATEFVKTSQNPDGSWGQAPRNRGVTGIVVTGLLDCGKTGAEDAPAAKGLKFIETLVNPQAGHIAGPDATVHLQNYVTSVNVMTLTAAKRPEKYKAIVGDGVKFLKKLQWDDEEGKTDKDAFYGGAGYDSKSRPDLSNTQFFIEALRDAGVPADDPSMKKALIFVSRCQNLKSEFNDQAWAGRINDGSFIYSAADGGQTKTSDDPKNDNLTGYGSMTYAGIKSMIYCGVGKEDKRYKAAYEWIQKNWTLDGNPGMPKELAERGLYYYYHTLAKTLDIMEVDQLTTADGQKHDWRAELTTAIAKRQKADGSFVNTNDRWMEGDPNLVTGYALMALSHCKPKK